jgi:protein CWC15
MGRESKGNSRQYSNKDLASHTKLKFRQPGQTSTSDVAQSDLRRQLLIAERAAIDKKRRDRGLGALPELVLPGSLRIENGEAADAEEGEESRKRRKVLEEVVGLDRDDEDDEDMGGEKGKGKAKDE